MDSLLASKKEFRKKNEEKLNKRLEMEFIEEIEKSWNYLAKGKGQKVLI